MIGTLIAVALLEFNGGGIELTVDSADGRAIDPARSVFLTVTMRHPSGVKATPPDFRDRVRGFSLAEDFAEEPTTAKDGRIVETVNWKLIPEPCAEVYKIAPFVVGDRVAGPIYFDSPQPREPVAGGMEVEVGRDLPPLSWRLVFGVLGFASGVLCLAALVWFAARHIARKVREHRMSPIERAWVELDRLLKKGLPGRGRYKDFYIELTMVVRRYIQRKYGIRAPHMTTEEFLREARPSDELRKFLESADMVKFAGVDATPEMADDATVRAKSYLSEDDREGAK